MASGIALFFVFDVFSAYLHCYDFGVVHVLLVVFLIGELANLGELSGIYGGTACQGNFLDLTA